MRLPLLFVLLACLFVHSPFAQAAEQPRPEYLRSFDPDKGFKSAQTDLAEIFLQLAGSLEAYGSPEPYLRHVASEHSRVEKLYHQKYGKEPATHRPSHLTDAYIAKLSENWRLLSPKLGLDTYTKGVGHMMRDAIKGTRGTGTIVVDIFNQHQANVFDKMAGKGKLPADFETLRAELVKRLELNKESVSEGQYEVARRDAVRCAIIIHGMTMNLFKRIDKGLKPDAAAAVKTVLTSMIMDVGQMAQSELEGGISEWAISRNSTAAK